jgi:hypothetical protein
LEILDQDMMQERVQVTGHFFKALMMRHALMTLAPIPPGVLDIMQDLTKNREHYGRHNHNDQGTSSHTNNSSIIDRSSKCNVSTIDNQWNNFVIL